MAKICSSKERLNFWLREKELLGDFGGLCFVCSKRKLCIRFDPSFRKDKVCWRCSNGKCNKKLSIRAGSWFSKSNLLLEQIVKFTFYWVYKCPADFVARELRIGSEHTLIDWYNFPREVCVETIKMDSEQIGADRKELEIDESKFRKRKYHRVNRVDGVWVFGGIERQSKKCFVFCKL